MFNRDLTIIEYASKQCTVDDFGEHEKDREYYNRHIGHSVICPDLKEDEGFVFQGENSAPVNKHVEFSVRKCNNETKKCKSESEINDFI